MMIGLPLIRTVSLMASVMFPMALCAEPLAIHGNQQTIKLSQQQLLALGKQQLITETPWTDGELKFEGASLERVLDLAGIQDGWVTASALDGYRISIPVENAVAAGAFVAAQVDGEPMRIKDKGPFWLVFPWSERPTLLNREVRSWAVWHLTQLSRTEQP